MRDAADGSSSWTAARNAAPPVSVLALAKEARDHGLLDVSDAAAARHTAAKAREARAALEAFPAACPGRQAAGGVVPRRASRKPLLRRRQMPPSPLRWPSAFLY